MFCQLCKQHNIILNKYIINNNYSYYFDNLILITDYTNYCFINSKQINNLYTQFNYNIISQNKTCFNIIKELCLIYKLDNTNKLDNTKSTDIFHIFDFNITFYKNDIDYIKLSNIFKQYYDNLIKHNTTYSLKKFNYYDKIIMLINEIQQVNKNKLYNHYIDIDFKNPFTFIVKCTFMEFNLIINPMLYPCVPPTLKYISPPIKDELYFSLLNLNILQDNNWTQFINIDYIISNVTKQIEPYFDKYKITHINLFHENMKLLGSLTNYKLSNIININIPIPKHNTTSCNSKKSGTGYSTKDDKILWNFKDFIQIKNIKINNIINCLTIIYNLMMVPSNIEYVYNEILLLYLNSQINELTILDLQNNIELYNIIFKILEYIIENNIDMYIKSLNIKDKFTEIYLELKEYDFNIDKHVYQLILKVITIYSSKYGETQQTNILKIDNLHIEYCNVMSKIQFDNNYIIPEYHSYYNNRNEIYDVKTKMYILSEISNLKKSLPLNWNSTIWFRMSKEHINIYTFIISGPNDTPYENGLFEFHLYLPETYPMVPPQVLLYNTGKHKLSNGFRFNPNIYENGKVCLSLLGTWNGNNDNEKWIPKISTILQVLISIQSLILIETPYFNEPGYENKIGTDEGNTKSDKYNKNLYPFVIEYTMIDIINNPSFGFEEIIKNHFKYKKNEILNTINKWGDVCKQTKLMVNILNKII